MCGILGFIDSSNSSSNEDLCAIINRMNKTLIHRGPDDGGKWVDETVGLALGHRRLSILDLSPEGHQPMVSSCGRFVTVFNGEIYNYRSIRSELDYSDKLMKWRGHSDTEVMLAAISTWGVEKALKKFNGMFAIALWDRKERRLILIRDRLGEKPLYYGCVNNTLFFGSELKAFREHPQWVGQINRDTLTLFLRYNYIPAPYTIYKNIFKLPAANILELHYDKYMNDRMIPEPKLYWSPKAIVESGVNTSLRLNEEQALIELERLLLDAVKLRMEADVPLGAFLSGGFDSSLIVALMQSQSSTPVRSFSIGFFEKDYNEAKHAKIIADHLGTDHTELYVSEQEAMEVIPQLPLLFDEPFADSSQIPTFIVSQLARKSVTVALSGDGGDELFCGYTRYALCKQLWRKIGWMPSLGRRVISSYISGTPDFFWNNTEMFFSKLIRKYGRSGQVADKMYKLADVLSVKSSEDFYQGLLTHWHDPLKIIKNANELPSVFTNNYSLPTISDLTLRAMYLDMISYLPDDILVKVDRTTMGVSLEARVPLLDHRVAELAWQIPLSMKYRNGTGKWLLRQLLYRYVPEEMMNRPKMGFGVPIHKWLRGPLREWAEELINESRLEQEGFFYPAPILQKWKEHLSGKRNWQYPLWDILMFQAWYSYWK